MINRTIHKNLSTSYVDVDALIRHLRSVQFVGSIRIEQDGFDGEIIFTSSNRMQACERDRTSKRMTKGVAAFKRILTRARRPHGRIHVFEPNLLSLPDGKARVDALISARARMTIWGRSDSLAIHLLPKKIVTAADSEVRDDLLDLVAELLRTVDLSLENSGLRFSDAFGNACAIIADECPFIDPNCGLFEYNGGIVRVGTTVSEARFLDAIFMALGRILDRLGEDREFENSLILTRLRMRALMRRREQAYRRLGLLKRLHTMLSR